MKTLQKMNNRLNDLYDSHQSGKNRPDKWEVSWPNMWRVGGMEMIEHYVTLNSGEEGMSKARRLT